MLKAVKVSEVLKDLYGAPFASPRSNQSVGLVELTVGEVFCNALLAPVQHPISYDDCVARADLALKITAAAADFRPVDLDDKELELIRGLVPLTNNLPLIVAKALGLLEEED